MTFREIVFRLSVEKSPELAGKLSSFADDVEKAYDTVRQQNEQASRQVGGSVPGMDTANLRQTTQQRVQAEREAQQQISNERTTIAELEEQVEADRRANQLQKIRKFTEERIEVEKALAKSLEVIREQMAEQYPGDEEALNTALEGARKAAAAKLEKIDERLQAERVRQAQSATKERLALLKQEERALEAAEAKYESMQEQIRSAKMEVMSALGEIGSSLMTTTRGFVALGLAGEEDMEKIVQGLLKVQGAFDIISGGIQTWIKVQQAIEGVRKVILATAAAEEALAAASAARAAAQGAGGIIGGAARGAAGGAVGNAVGGAVGGAAAGALSRTRLAGALAGRVGGGLAGAARLAGPLAVVGAGLGLGADYFSGDGYSRGGFGEFAGAGFIGVENMSSFARYMNPNNEGGLFMDDKPFIDYANSRDALSRQRMFSSQMQARHAQQVETVNSQLGGLRAGFDVRAQTDSRRLSLDMDGLDARQQEKRVAEEILRVESQIAEVKEAASQTAGRFEGLITEFDNEQARLEQRKRDLAIERAVISRDAAAAELESSEKTLANIDARIQRQQQQLQTMQEAVASSRERFGLLDDAQQQNLLDIFRRGQAGEALSPEELRQLKQIGSDAADAIVAGQAEARARRAGASALFKVEQGEIDKITRQIEQNVELRADVKWEVEFDKKALEEQVQELDRVMRSSLEEQLNGVVDRVESGLAGVVGGINVRIDNLEQRVVDGAGGR